MPENLDNVVEEGNKVDYVDLKDLRKEQRKKELSEKYQAFKEKIGNAVSKGKSFISKSKEVTGKAYEASKEGIKKFGAGVEKFRDKAQKFDKFIKGNKRHGTPAKYVSSVKRRQAIMRAARRERYVTPEAVNTFSGGIGLTPNNQNDDIFGSFAPTHQPKQSSNDFGMGNIFNAPRTSKKQVPSDDFGMGNIFGSSGSKKSKKRNNSPFDML